MHAADNIEKYVLLTLVITINKTEEEAKGEVCSTLLVRVTSRGGSAFALNKPRTNALH